MRTLPSGFADAIAGGVDQRVYATIKARDRATGSEVVYNLHSGPGNVTAEVIDGLTGATDERTFIGECFLGPDDGVEYPRFQHTSTMDVRDVELVLNILHSTVAEMVRGDDVRRAPIQIYLGPNVLLTPLQAAPAVCEFVGRVDESPITTGEVGGQSFVTLRCVSTTEALTLGRPAVRSHEALKRRNPNDDFRQYAEIMPRLTIHWGKEKITGSGGVSNSGSGHPDAAALLKQHRGF